MKSGKSTIGFLLIFTGLILTIILSLSLDNMFILFGFLLLILIFRYFENYPIRNKVALLVKEEKYEDCITYLEGKYQNNFLAATDWNCVIELIALYMLTDRAIEAKKLLVTNKRIKNVKALFYIRFLLAIAEDDVKGVQHYANKIINLRNKKYKAQQESVIKIVEMLKTGKVNNEIYEGTKYPLLKKICQRINGEDVVIETTNDNEVVVERVFTNISGLKKLIKVVLNIVSILTLIIGMILISILSNDDFTSLESSYYMLKSLWILFLFIPIPLVNISYGFYLKVNNYKYKSNVIIGSIFSVLLFMYGLMSLISIKVYSEDKNYLYQLDDILAIDFPDDFTIVIMDYTGGEQSTIDNCLIKYESVVRIKSENYSNFDRKYWNESIYNRDMIPTLFLYQTQTYDYFLVYCFETKEYNPTNYIQNYNYVAIAYDIENSNYIIYEYYIKSN